jgi:hypothetical protein
MGKVNEVIEDIALKPLLSSRACILVQRHEIGTECIQAAARWLEIEYKYSDLSSVLHINGFLGQTVPVVARKIMTIHVNETSHRGPGEAVQQPTKVRTDELPGGISPPRRHYEGPNGPILFRTEGYSCTASLAQS